MPKVEKNIILRQQILDLRTQGLRDAQIGKNLGISRQRVHQIRKQENINPKIYTVAEVAKLINIPECRVRRAISLLTPTSEGHYRFNPELFSKVKEYIEAHSKCKLCGNVLPDSRNGKRLYCESCSMERRKYKNMPVKSRESIKRNSRKWQLEHPERVKEIIQKSNEKQKQKHFAETTYIVKANGSPLSIGNLQSCEA